jgi:hypothetical protein
MIIAFVRTMESCALRDIMPCIPAEVIRRFEEIYRLIFQVGRAGEARNPHEAGSKKNPI